MKGRGWTLAGLGVLLFFGLFLVYPTLRLGLGSLEGAGHWAAFLTRAYYRSSIWNSLWLSTLATAGSVLLGVPLALLVSRYRLPLTGLIRLLAVFSLLSPPFIGAYAWVILLGRAGVITRLLGLEGFSIYGWGGVLLIFVLHHFAYVFLLTAAALSRIDPALEEAAESLGVSPRRRLWTVTVPLALPGIAAGALLVFITTLADFGTPMLIGEGLRTLPVLAYNEFLSELGGSGGLASVASVGMLALALAALALHGWIVGRRSYEMRGLRAAEPRALGPRARWLASAAALGVTGAAALPQAVVLITSFAQMRGPRFTGSLGLENYRLMVDRMLTPVLNTLLYATSAAVLMLGLGMAVAYLLVRRPGWLSRSLDWLLVLAQILPGTVLGIGLILAWGRPPLMLTGTGLLLIVAYIVRRIAFTVRAAASGLRQVGPAVEEASLTLGADPLRTFLRITVPLILPAAVAGALISWVTTLSELSSTIMLYTGRTATVSVLIYNQVLNDTFGPAAALGTLLMVLTALSLLLLRRLGGKYEGFTL